MSKIVPLNGFEMDFIGESTVVPIKLRWNVMNQWCTFKLKLRNELTNL